MVTPDSKLATGPPLCVMVATVSNPAGHQEDAV
jgi:hypothetical protein